MTARTEAATTTSEVATTRTRVGALRICELPSFVVIRGFTASLLGPACGGRCPFELSAFDGFDDPVIGELRGSCRLAKSFGRLRLEDVQDRLVTREKRGPQVTDIGAELCREPCAFALSVDGAHGCIRLHQVARHQPPTVEQPSPGGNPGNPLTLLSRPVPTCDGPARRATVRRASRRSASGGPRPFAA